MTEFLSVFSKHSSLYVLSRNDDGYDLAVTKYDTHINEAHIWSSLVNYLLPNEAYLRNIRVVQNAAGITWFEQMPVGEECDQLTYHNIGDYVVFLVSGKYLVHIQRHDDSMISLDDPLNVDSFIDSLHASAVADDEYAAIFETAKKEFEESPERFSNIRDAIMSIDNLEDRLTESDYKKYKQELDELFSEIKSGASEEELDNMQQIAEDDDVCEITTEAELHEAMDELDNYE
jgi:hypothetical protein